MFSKCSICVGHIEGGGCLDLTRKNFWRRARTPQRAIQIVDSETMIVNGTCTNIITWLQENEILWYPQWANKMPGTSYASLRNYGVGLLHYVVSEIFIGLIKREKH